MHPTFDEDDHRAATAPTGRRRARRWKVAATIVVAGLALAGCGSGVQSGGGTTSPTGLTNTGLVESTDKPTLGGTVAYGLSSETNGWNPATNQWGPSGWQVARTFFDNLFAFDQDGNVQPFLAQSIDHDATFTTWTMRLRSGITYSDGSPVTAESVAQAQRLMAASSVTGPGYEMVDTIVADGEDKVVFTTTQPWAAFPTLLTTQVGVVAEPGWLATNDGLHPVGTGPFTLDSWNIGSQLVVVKNPGYWQSDRFGNRYPYLDKVTYRIIVDGSARAAALEAGDIDAAEIIEPETIKSLQAKGDAAYQVFSDSDSETTEYFVMLNTQKAPFDDIDARRAIAYATDRQAYVDTVQAGLFLPADGPFTPSSPWYDADNGFPDFDPAKAKELVTQVKARNGGSFEMTLTAPNNSVSTVGLQVLQQMYQDVGIDVKVKNIEGAALIIDAVTGNYQSMLFGGWFYAHPDEEIAFIDPRTAYAPPQFSLNLTRNGDPSLTPLIDAYRAAATPEEQRRTMAAVVRKINEGSAYIWLYHAQVAIVAKRNLVNLLNYTLPDGQQGLDLREGSHPMTQVWIRS